MQKFTKLEDLLVNIEGFILGKENLIFLGDFFQMNLLNKTFLLLLKESDDGLSIRVEEENYKSELEVSFDELVNRAEASLLTISNFVCNALGVVLSLEEKENFFLQNSMTGFPTTLSKDLVLTSYITHSGFLEKVREVKLEEKNIKMNKEGQVLIKNKGQLFIYVINEEKKQKELFNAFIEV